MSSSPMLSSPLVLLVDDDEDSRYLYALYMTSTAGYRVAEAGDGQEAIKLATELLPDIVVMDLTLPVVDGREAMRVIRSDAKTSGIPIIALTGHSNVKAQNQPATEFQAVLLKPCLPDVVVRTIEGLLRK